MTINELENIKVESAVKLDLTLEEALYLKSLLKEELDITYDYENSLVYSILLKLGHTRIIVKNESDILKILIKKKDLKDEFNLENFDWDKIIEKEKNDKLF